MPFFSILKVQLFAIFFLSFLMVLPAQDSLVKVQGEISLGRLPLSTDSSGAAIFVERDTLFYIYQSLGTLKVSERASIINQRLESLHEVYNPETDSLLYVKSKDRVLYKFEEQLLFKTTKLEAEQLGMTLEELAQKR